MCKDPAGQQVTDTETAGVIARRSSAFSPLFCSASSRIACCRCRFRFRESTCLRRHRCSRTKPVDPDPHAASGNHDPLRRRRAGGGIPGTAVRRRLSRLQSPRAPLGVASGERAHRTRRVAELRSGLIVLHAVPGTERVERREALTNADNDYKSRSGPERGEL